MSRSSIKSMRASQLVKWLDEELKQHHLDGLTNEQREKLIKEGVTGEVFLDLTKDDLVELGFNLGARKNIQKMIDSASKETKSEDVPSVESNGEPTKTVTTKEQDATNGNVNKTQDQFPAICSVGLVMPPTASNDSTGRSLAWGPEDKYWRGKSELRVFFIQDIPVDWEIDRQGVSRRTILEKANIWNKRETSIPKFIESDDLDHSDIRVKFYDCVKGTKVFGRNESQVGSNADNHKGEATMYLDLSNSDNNYKNYVIVHEFGHALGLGHEHQRSKFWDSARKFINVTKMYEAIIELSPPGTVTYEQFCNQWGVDKRSGSGTPSYDPDSVMHYWYDTEWLEDHFSKYKDLKEVENQANPLSPDERKVLRGVHRKLRELPTVPSKDDVEFLKEKYSTSSTTASAPPKAETETSTTIREVLIEGKGTPRSTDSVDRKVVEAFREVTVGDSDWATICGFLKKLNEQKIQQLGAILGIEKCNLEKMKHLPDNMVSAWLIRQDNVIENCGYVLKWKHLLDALKEIGGGGIIGDILTSQVPQEKLKFN